MSHCQARHVTGICHIGKFWGRVEHNKRKKKKRKPSHTCKVDDHQQRNAGSVQNPLDSDRLFCSVAFQHRGGVDSSALMRCSSSPSRGGGGGGCSWGNIGEALHSHHGVDDPGFTTAGHRDHGNKGNTTYLPCLRARTKRRRSQSIRSAASSPKQLHFKWLARGGQVCMSVFTAADHQGGVWSGRQSPIAL